jgi:hypothetical protein
MKQFISIGLIWVSYGPNGSPHFLMVLGLMAQGPISYVLSPLTYASPIHSLGPLVHILRPLLTLLAHSHLSSLLMLHSPTNYLTLLSNKIFYFGK